MSVICFVVGGPAAGKSTLVKSFLDWKNMTIIEKPKITISKKVCAAGHYTGGKFDGADTIPYNQDLKTAKYLAKKSFFNSDIVFLDGDRMSNKKVKDFFKPYNAVCVYLEIDLDTHKLRAAKRKSNQNITWVKGRLTKSKNFFNNFKTENKIKIDGTLKPEEIQNITSKFLESF